jgi:hypothetical protein
MHSLSSAVCTRLIVHVDCTEAKSRMQEKRYKANKAAADKGWSQEEHGNGNVKHLIETDFDEWRAQHAPLLAMFYAPWCVAPLIQYSV